MLFQQYLQLQRHDFSKRFEADGITFPEPNELMFNFNNPYGACQKCSGSGQVEGISEDLVITRPDLSVYDGVVNCWKGEIMKKFQKDFINKAFEKFLFSFYIFKTKVFINIQNQL